MRCPHCGGNLYRDDDDRDQAACLQCARRTPLLLGREGPGERRPERPGVVAPAAGLLVMTGGKRHQLTVEGGGGPPLPHAERLI